MSNRLNATDRIDIVPEVEGTTPFDHAPIIRRAEQLRGEELARLIGGLWRWIRSTGERLTRTPAGGHDTAALDDHTLADIGVTRHQIPGFVAREVGAARDIARRTRSFRAPAPAA